MNARAPGDRLLWCGLGVLALLVGVGMRLQLASVAQTPGHGDSAFYYTVATNIAAGRGVVVDYVVYFFLGLVPLTRYAGDFWNPLAEILLSLPMLVLGASIFHALLASIAAGIVPAVVGFLAGRRFAGSTRVGIFAGVLTFFSPFMIVESVRTEAIIFFGAFGSVALYLAARGRSGTKYFMLAALCTGVAHFTRQDGVLLLLALVACIGVAPIPWRRRLAVAAVAIGVHGLVLSPLLIRNMHDFGSPLQPGPSSTAFMTSYEDFHAYGKEMTWQTLRADWGIQRIVNRRLHTAGENLAQVKFFVNPYLLLLVSLGAVNLAFTKNQPRDLVLLLPAFFYWCIVYAFYTLVASFSGPGSLPKSLAVLLPFTCVLVADLFASRIRSSRWLAGVLLALAAYFGYRGYQTSLGSAVYWNKIYDGYSALRQVVDDDAAARGADPQAAIIMARDVWDVYEGTGLRAVMIPNNDLETIFLVARHYGAEYMLLPAPRPALDDIYHGRTPDPRFVLLGPVPGTDWSLYRIEPDAARISPTASADAV